MRGSLRLGKIAGIEISVHFSWLLVFGLVTYTVASTLSEEAPANWSEVSYWSVGVVAALLLFVSIVVHELSHSLVARARGMQVDGITLFVLGGVSRIGSEPRRAGDEFWMAVVGPLTSLLLAAAAISALLVGVAPNEQVETVFVYAAEVNLALAVFNLLPGFPLDGGRILRAAIWRLTGDLSRATRIAASAGRVVAVLLIAAGFALALLTGNMLSGFWMAIIGFFLLGGAGFAAAQTERQHALSQRNAAQSMETHLIAISPELPLHKVAELAALPGAPVVFPVVVVDRLRGVVTASSLLDIPPDRWFAVPAAQVMHPAASLSRVGLDSTLPARTAAPVLVLSGDRLVGVVPPEAPDAGLAAEIAGRLRTNTGRERPAA